VAGIITIENHNTSASFKTKGAELCSLINKETAVEHIWQADPNFWPRHAPILFPCIGSSKNDKVIFDGQKHLMPRHGFARNMKFQVEEKANDRVTFSLQENETSLVHYPFRFKLSITFRLEGKSLYQEMVVENTDSQVIGFQIGAHPAFAIPFSTGNYESYEIHFSENVTAHRHLLTDSGTYSGETCIVLEDNNSIPLTHQLFHEDAIVFKDFPLKSASIVNRETGKGIKVNYQGFPHLGIWAAKNADFACIEPWVGCADNDDFSGSFWEKDSVIKLEPTETFNCAFSVGLI